jgi:nucleotide-binding universal stress UspA family protein
MTEPIEQKTGPILIPVDGSDFAAQAAPYAAAIGGPDGAFVLLRVIPKARAVRGLFGTELLSAELVQQANEKAARASLESISSDCFAGHDHATIEVIVGDPADEILRAADRFDASMIALATHGLQGIDRWIIGSVADRVAHMSRAPVMLVRPSYVVSEGSTDIGFTRIVVPLDGSSLAAEAIPVARQLATRFRLPVCLVTVSELPREFASVLAYGAAFSAQAYQELLDQGSAESRVTLDAAAAPLREAGLTVETCLLRGPVPEAIASITGPDDLIVMTSHGRSGIARWFMGSVATKLIQQGGAPVLLVPSSIRLARAPDKESTLLERSA